MFPSSLTISPGSKINSSVDWLVVNYGDSFSIFSEFLLKFFIPVEFFFRNSPWWLIIFSVGCLAYFSSRNLFLTVSVIFLFFLMGVLGLWDESMQTLALVIVSTTLTVAAGVPLGILLSKLGSLRFLVLPVLDAMQTLPSFVYLIPVLMLFGLGKIPALLATFIYALPPVIRLTDLGIRQVRKDVTEAADSFGSTFLQRLWKVELPLATPSIMTGVNQATMMALSMVVISSMIGNRGLGQEVLLGINTLDIGRGAIAGLAIVCMAIVIDRITQSFVQRIQSFEEDKIK